jgi:hypothetical protein
MREYTQRRFQDEAVMSKRPSKDRATCMSAKLAEPFGRGKRSMNC